MDDDNYLETFQEILRNVFFDERITIGRETTAVDVDGWDSLSHVRVLLELEKSFKTELRDAEAACAQNVGELIEIIKARRGE